MTFTSPVTGEAVPVELRRTDTGWQLLRGGEPYFIRGAGGDGSLASLAAAGANSVRTWGAENAGAVLDEAHALGLTVTLGLWLGHERHGFDYGDPQQLRQQLARIRETVLRHRDHPALLLWGVGNEMEGFGEGDDPRVWAAVNEVAATVKALDPHHPTMTVTTFVHGARIEYLHRRSPAIDIHGVNAYGGAVVVPEHLRAGGAVKPFVLTEFGPVGPWEMPKTDWGAPIEPTSTAKAATYREAWQRGVLAAPGLALGGYAFLWGHKVEATHTWFGMWLEDGSRTAAVDVMTELWSGEAPPNRAPRLAQPLSLEGPAVVDPGAVVTVRAEASDPEGDTLRAHWELRREADDHLTGGDFRTVPAVMPDAVIAADPGAARVRLPQSPGPYRLFYTLRDGAGGVATANLPLLVRGEPRTALPLPVYEEGFDGMPWAPSGWMGGMEHLSLDGACAENPHEGRVSIRLRYEGRFGWAGVAWQHPANDWGERDGGYDLSGASALELWARGAYGGEQVSFGVGLLEADSAFPDSTIAKVDGIVLTDRWQRYRVPLRGRDLSRIKTGFVVTLTGRATPVTIYLDSIRFVP